MSIQPPKWNFNFKLLWKLFYGPTVYYTHRLLNYQKTKDIVNNFMFQLYIKPSQLYQNVEMGNIKYWNKT
jgi:hypothetical protein